MEPSTVSSAFFVVLRILTIFAFIPWTWRDHFPLQILGCIFLFFLALLSLCYADSEKWELANESSKHRRREVHLPPKTIYRTRALGLIAGLYILYTAHFLPSADPLDHVRIRVLAFFNAAKILDLAVARASRPPMRLENGLYHPIQHQSGIEYRRRIEYQRRIEYIWLLAAETRYHSFDIAIYEPGREQPAKRIWTYGPLLILPIALWIFPRRVELYILLSLLIIQFGGEGMHRLLHPYCKYPMFYQPLAARSIGAYWRVHWHSAAASFLYTLGYQPARNAFSGYFGKRVGKAAGVLGAFCVSGIWHGWAAAALSTTPWRTGVGIWALFMGHGVACIVEGAFGKGMKGGMVMRVVVWAFALWTVGVWVKDSLPRSNVPFAVWLGEELGR